MAAHVRSVLAGGRCSGAGDAGGALAGADAPRRHGATTPGGCSYHVRNAGVRLHIWWVSLNGGNICMMSGRHTFIRNFSYAAAS